MTLASGGFEPTPEIIPGERKAGILRFIMLSLPAR